nr:ribosome maturation factor RimM [Desulfobulbus alkaliphilus]
MLGTVTKPHGIRGELKVRPVTEQPENIARYRHLYLAVSDQGRKMPCTNIQARVNGRTVILKLEECSTREQAEQLAGMRIWVASSDLPSIDGDQFYLHTLVGKQGWTVDGEIIGMVRALMSAGGQDILVLGEESKEYLIPVTRKFIVAIEEDRIVFDLPPGLLEINS